MFRIFVEPDINAKPFCSKGMNRSDADVDMTLHDEDVLIDLISQLTKLTFNQNDPFVTWTDMSTDTVELHFPYSHPFVNADTFVTTMQTLLNHVTDQDIGLTRDVTKEAGQSGRSHLTLSMSRAHLDAVIYGLKTIRSESIRWGFFEESPRSHSPDLR